MATVEQRNHRYRVIFYFGGKRYASKLSTTTSEEAEAIAGSVQRTLMLIEQGVLDVPEGTDFVAFVISGGRRAEKPQPPPARSLGDLRQRYIQALSSGAIEQNSLDTLRMHLGHFVKTLGANFPIQTLAHEHLQQHVDRRAKKKGHFKRPLSPVTLRKEMASLRACWNWGLDAGLVKGKFPGKGIKYPKTEEKPAFQTWEEIEKRVGRGGLAAVEQKELWNSLYLTSSDIEEFFAHARTNAQHDFVHPMVVFAAHTGARRSEMLRARIDDVDFTSGTVVIHEKKRVRGQRTHRRVPLSPLLEAVLRDWISRHPGGQYLFCHRLDVPRSKKRRTEFVPLTRNEANDHFKRLIADGKWQVLRGWHVFRHSFVSNCASKGVDQRMIDEWAGHQTEAMRKRYRHLFPSQQRQALRSVFGNGE